MITLIYFIIILGVIVLVHEFGHFIFSKMFGIYVYEFSIGMGPKLFGWKGKKGDTDYSIRAIPIGGYCSLAGEDNEYDDENKVPKDARLQSKPAWQRFLVMFFGAGNNFILAFILLLVIGLCYGAVDQRPIINNVNPDYPAYQAGLRDNDKVIKVNGNTVTYIDDLSIYVQVADKSKPMDFVVVRDGKKIDYTVQPILEEQEDGSSKYVVGFTAGNDNIKHDFGSIIEYTFTKLASLFKQMFITFKLLFTGGVGVKDLSGPVGIYSIVGTYRQAGFENILYLTALLSVNVGFINLIPLPAFDGGRILFVIIEKIKGSPVKPEVENKIHTIGFILLLLLMVFITFNDIIKLF